MFIAAFASLAYPFLLPARIKRFHCERFVRAAADFLAHASDRDRNDISRDLVTNIDRIIRIARKHSSFGEETSAFYDFIHRREIMESDYARSFLTILSEPSLCSVLVSRSPWDTAALLRKISRNKLRVRSADAFIRELGRQAVIAPESMLAREIGYKGFYVAPVLSEILFGDDFLCREYKPASGLGYRDFEDMPKETIDRLNHAIESTLKVLLAKPSCWHESGWHFIEDNYERLSGEVHAQVRSNRKDNFEALLSMRYGVVELIRIANESLSKLDQHSLHELYIQANSERSFDLLDRLAEMVFKVLCSFSNDFAGHNDAYWSIALDLFQVVFPRYEDQPSGMNPLQQRVAIKILDKVQDNMRGYYPAVTRVLLAIAWPPSEAANRNDHSAWAILTRAFYFELRRFPNLYAKDAKKAAHYLPPSIKYNAKKKRLSRKFADGSKRSAKLGTHLTCVSLEPDAIRSQAQPLVPAPTP